MAEKSIKNTGKKWIIILSALVLVAVAVVLIIVLIPKDIGRLKEKIQNEAQTMFLAKEEDLQQFVSFKSKVSNVTSEDYGTEAENVYSLGQSLCKITTFYADGLIFANDNKTFQDNYSSILKNFERADVQLQKMMDIVKSVNDQLNQNDKQFVEGAWKTFKVYFKEYLTYTSNAARSLYNVYISCVPQGVCSNEMTYLVLDTVNIYLEVINNDIENCTSKIEYLTNFVEYFNPSNTALRKYVFSENLQSSINKVKSFKSVYGREIKDLISSIDKTGFTFESQVVDAEGVLLECQSFLQGGLN